MAPTHIIWCVYVLRAVLTSLCCYFTITRISLYLRRRKIKLENGCKPPVSYPHKDPIFGIDIIRVLYRSRKNKTVLEDGLKRVAKLGHTFTITVPAQLVIATIEPENLKSVLATSHKDYALGLRAKALRPLLGNGVFTNDGDMWQHSRAMIRPNFVKEQIADLDAFEAHIQNLFNVIPRDGSTIDLQDLFFKLTIDTATEFLFGKSVLTLLQTSAPDEDEFVHAFRIAQADAVRRTLIGQLIQVDFPSREVAAALKICHGYVDQFVDQALLWRATQKYADEDSEKEKDSYIFMHELARQTNDRKRLRDELLNVLFAGRDTTASLLSVFFYQLVRRHDIMTKLRAEVDGLDGRLPTYEELRNMKYLKYCLNETLRLYPVFVIGSRQAIRDSILPLGGGEDGQSPLFVAKGTIVAWNLHALHRRKDYYGADAENFRPERWEALRPSWEYLPFNGGPRICIGQQYALVEAMFVTVRLLQEYRTIEPRDDTPWFEGLTLTLFNGNGTKVSLSP